MNSWPDGSRLERTTFSGLRRGQLMARVRSRGNGTTERRLVALLRGARLTGWRRHVRLPGRPDFCWREARVVVFVDGCFWHGHLCRNVTPKTNAVAWRKKIHGNRVRDRRVDRRLRGDGWSVLRIWECQLARSPERSIAKIGLRLEQRRSTATASLGEGVEA